ncbi:MAG: SlyX family protein [Gammaproteobacteria bacterium]|nr:SlyX family protein [Gammaproteobacteria bacterium]
MEERIIELETRLAYQEDLLQELNDRIAEQQLQIDKQAMQIGLLRQQMLAVTPSNVVDLSQETPPPHY